MTTNLDILVRARDEATRTIQGVSKAGADLQKSFGSVSDRMKAAGSTLTKTLTPAAAGAALVFAKAGQQWDDGIRSLVAGSDLTGQALQDLIGDAKDVAGNVTQSFDQVAAAMDDISDRTGLTGSALSGLTTQFLELEHLTGEAASSTIPNVTRLFGDWSIATQNQADTLDELYRASEATGISVGTLSGLMVQFGSPLRQLGLDFDTTAAMLSKFEKEGVNIQTVLPGLRMALKNFATEGRDPAEALQETIDQIKNASSTMKANQIAFKVFGTRAGPDLAAAIREGRFDFDELISHIKTGKSTIQGATDDTHSFADTMAELRNKIMTTIGPFGDVGAAIAGVVAGIGPFLFGLSQIIPQLGKLKTALMALGRATPWIAAAIVAFEDLRLVIGLATGDMSVFLKYFDVDATPKAIDHFIQVLGVLSPAQVAARTEMQHTIATVEDMADSFLRVPAPVSKSAAVLDQFTEATGAALDKTGKTEAVLADARAAYADLAGGVADSVNGIFARFDELAAKPKSTFEALERGIKANLRQLKAFGADLRTIGADAKAGVPGAQELLDHIIQMGPAGQHVADLIASATPKARRALERDIGGGFEKAKSIGQQMATAIAGSMDRVAAAILVATGKATSFKAALDKIHDVHATITAEANTQNALDQFHNLVATIEAARPTLHVNLDTSLSGRAAGGPVDAGAPYIVGERGPEMFVPSASGRIVPRVAWQPDGHSGGMGGRVAVDVRITDAKFRLSRDGRGALEDIAAEVYDRKTDYRSRSHR